jgi:hypothetical protein
MTMHKQGRILSPFVVKTKKYVFGRVLNGKMVLNDFGIMAHNEWLKTAEKRTNVELDVFVIMSNLIHCIIHVIRRGELHSPLQISQPPRDTSQTVGAILRGYKSAVVKQLNKSGFMDR